MHKHLYIALLSIIMVTASTSANARPISYPGGVAAMVMNDGSSNSANIQYSPTATMSIGYTFEHWRAMGQEDDFNLHAMQMNNLLKRWNNPDSQGNLYLESGIGLTGKNDGVHPVAFTGIETDWEDRRFLVSYKNRYTTGQEIDDFYMQSARVGVAPYIGKFGDLHTWLMVQVDHNPSADDPVTVTPLVRLFKGTNLIEAGVSNNGKILFNWMTQF